MKKILTLVACLLTLGAMAQEEDTVNKVANIDWNENVDELKTVDDLVKERQDVANRAAREEHMKKIWANHGYFHIAWHTVGNLDPQETCLGKFNKKKIIEPGIKTGMGDELVSKYERDWGVSIIAGKNIKLHSPIADILQFNLDFTGVDININHFKGSKKTPIYDSGYKETDKKEKKATNQFTYYDKNLPKEALYSHWNAEQYEAGYGMNLGPSITIAPFSRLYGAKELHFLKFNFYYHIGYRASFLFQRGNSEKDASFTGYPDDMEAPDFAKRMEEAETLKQTLDAYNPTQVLVGHGLYQSIGFNVVWKRIGMGFEHTWSKGIKYRNLTKTSTFGGKGLTYKFEPTTNRLYISYRFGK